MSFNFLLKKILGTLLPDSFFLKYFARLPEFNTWVKKYDLANVPAFESREELYEYVYSSKLNNTQLTYFEMGVWYGSAIKSWNTLDSNQESRYFGFDTFEGLPEVWEGLTANAEVGTFDVGGSIDNVKISDKRVKLIQGLFQDTVPGFLADEYEATEGRRVLHIDSDLYSSALFCLTKFDHIMAVGDIIIFDELSSMDEFRALQDYCTAYLREYRVLGHSGPYYQQVAIELTL